MANTTVSLRNGLKQTFRFMKLLPELRLIVYELAMRSYLEDVDRTNIRGPPGIGVSLETKNKTEKARSLEIAELHRHRKSKAAAPYLGALALLQTSKVVYSESCNDMQVLVSSHRNASYDSMREALRRRVQARRDGAIRTADLLGYEHEDAMAVWLFMMTVSRSFENTAPRELSDYDSTVSHGNLHGQATQPAPSITNSIGSARSAAEISREATLLAAVKYFPNIYTSIQCGPEDSAGVRPSFKQRRKTASIGKSPTMRLPS
jgi:hypothetical protein